MALDNCEKYKEAGVDFNVEEQIVKCFVEASQKTKTDSYLKEYEGFFANCIDFKNSIVAFATDGAGTKPMVHELFRKSDIKRVLEKYSEEEQNYLLGCCGIDAVAMVVNDLLCVGAEPITLSNYTAWGKPNVELAKDIAIGLEIGCKEAGCCLIGGENAILKEMLKSSYDTCCYGFGLIKNKFGKIKENDTIIGLRSSGIHCNGISLARRTLIKCEELGWNGRWEINEKIPELDKTPAEIILTPTLIYVKPVLKALNNFNINALAHITGGGLNNLLRVLKLNNVGASLDFSTATLPHDEFLVIQREGNVSAKEMYNVFNMGFGMHIVVNKEEADDLIQFLSKESLRGKKLQAEVIGEITKEKGLRCIAYSKESFKIAYN